MRVYSENDQIQLETDSFEKASAKGAIGRFKVKMTRKQACVMDLRRFSLALSDQVNWVEDGFHIVMGQMLFSNDSLLPYLGYAYPSPELMAANERHTKTKGERRPLLYRIRHMLQSLKKVSDKYENFGQWHFTGLESAMQSFDEMIQQAFGSVAHNEFYMFYRRLRRLWRAVAPELDSPAAVEKELDSLVETAEAVFATIRRCCELKESEQNQANAKAKAQTQKLDAATEKVEKAADDVTAAASDIRETNRLSRKAVNIVEHLAEIAKPRINAEPDQTSREAGLHKLNPARQKEIRAASEISHREFPIVRNAKKKDDYTLLKLALKTWRANRDEFEALAKLNSNPGFSTPQALAAALYRLAKNYPNAAHFCWIENKKNS